MRQLLKFAVFASVLVSPTLMTQSVVKISATSGGFVGPLADMDLFGQAVARLGDVNGDGFVDIAVGAHFDDSGGFSASGAVWILFLDASGQVLGEQKIAAGVGGMPAGLGTNDNFGIAVASPGDLDGNGVPDLAVGAWLDDDGGSNRGAVWILFLASSGTVISSQKISSTLGGLVGPLDNDDNFGNDVASLGDLDGDGIGDLAVSASRDDDGATDRGAVYVLLLNANGTVKAEQKISATTGGFTGALTATRFGLGLCAIGDLDLDGTTELAVGSPLDTDGGSSRGAVFVLFLTATGTVTQTQKISATDGGFTGALSPSDLFGSRLAGPGDVDNDGVPDLVVGTPSDDDGGTDRGAVYTLHLTASGTVASHTKLSHGSGGASLGLDDGDAFGQSVAWMGSGCLGLVAGARGDDDGGVDRGAVYVLSTSTGGATVPCIYPTIQAAIDALPTGSEITVGPGAYTEHDIDFGGKNLILRSTDGPLATVIDAQSMGRGFIFDSGETSAAVVSGFTIRNGKAPNGAFGQPGQGGGAVLITNASPKFHRCIFSDNLAGDGGSSLPANVGPSGGGGGAVAVTGGAPSFRFCEFQRNRAGAGGNGASGFSIFVKNGSNGGVGGSGGAVSVGAGSALLLRCTVAANRGGDGGDGGVGFTGPTFGVGGTGGNGGSSGDGGGLAVAASATLTLINSIVWGNLAGAPGAGGSGGPAPSGGSPGAPGSAGAVGVAGLAGTASIDSCNIQGVAGSTDPLFVNLVGGDVHLQPNSPMAGAGNLLLQGVNLGGAFSDIDGEPVAMGSPDLGADEVASAAGVSLTPTVAGLGSPTELRISGAVIGTITEVRVGGTALPFVFVPIALPGPYLSLTVPAVFTPAVLSVEFDFGFYTSATYSFPSGLTLAFQLDSVSPNAGSVLGGESITLSGPGIGIATGVTFGTTPATFSMVDVDTLTATTPPALAGGPVDVRVHYGAIESVLPAAFTYEFQLLSVAPTVGPVAGGTIVTLSGPGLGTATSVSFGSVAAASFSVIDASTLEAVAPAQAAGVVSVSAHIGMVVTTLPAAFQYRVPVTILVPGSYATVAAAVTASLGGDTILIGPGIHSVNNVDLGGRNLTIQGASGSAPTILDGGYTGRIFLIQNGETAATLLSRLVLSYGYGVGAGGAIAILGTSPTIEDCSFLHNRASSDGGAVAIVDGAPHFVGCRFYDNGAGTNRHGGAVHIDNSLGVQTGTPTFEDCTFADNRAGVAGSLSSGGDGGAIHDVGPLLLRRCIFALNQAGSPAASAALVMGLGRGGGVYATTLAGTDLITIENCVFERNKAGSRPSTVGPAVGTGGAVAIDGAASLRWCTFHANEGGASAGTPIGDGGGLWMGSGSATLDHCLFWGNVPTQIFGSAVASFCDVQGGYPGVMNFSGDPLFVDANNGDFALNGGSPCIDAGDVNALSLPATDLDGDPRVMGARVDVGAQEFATAAPVYPGTGEDLQLTTLVNGGGNPFQGQKAVTGGDQFTIHLESPGGAFTGFPFLIVGDVFTTGNPPPSIIGGAHVSVFSFFILRDAFTAGPGGIVPMLPSNGVDLTLVAPPGVSGLSLMVQGAIVTPTAANGLIVITDGHEIQLFPSL